MLKYTMIILFLIFFLVNSSTAEIKSEFKENTYYEPKPGVMKSCTPCIANRTSCKYPAWKSRMEPEGKKVFVCNEFDECLFVEVPKGGKWYNFFTWDKRQQICL